MKKIWILAVLALLLTGCGAQETFETISDVYAVPASAAVYEVQMSLPEEAVLQTMEAGDGSKLYLCDRYTVTVQTLDAGDMDRTLRTVTGFGKEQLRYLKTRKDGFACYNCAWSTAGEEGNAVCRAVILDDGNSHHAVTVMADYTDAADLTARWQHILDSVSLVSTG